MSVSSGVTVGVMTAGTGADDDMPTRVGEAASSGVAMGKLVFAPAAVHAKETSVIQVRSGHRKNNQWCSIILLRCPILELRRLEDCRITA
jgi:hypothetical protein